MKTKAICSFFVLFAIVAGMITISPAAFADAPDKPHNIETADNDLNTPVGEESCLQTEAGCYTPNPTTVTVGHTVTMTNTDGTNTHTFTSGTVDGFAPTPSDVFDSGALNVGESFDYLADTEGEFPYYCSLHVWMQGTLIVQAAAEEEMQMDEKVTMEDEVTMEETVEEEAMEETVEEEVELTVTITESAMGDGTHVNLEFSEIHVNYEMIGMQNDEEIFTIPGHAMEMTSDHHIDAVGTPESPLDIKIVPLGIGPPDAEDDWTSATITDGDTIQVVPEFGTIAMMILGVSIISIIALSAKSRVILKL